MLLTNLVLPGRGSRNTFNVEISDEDGTIRSIDKHARSQSHETPPSRVIPTLCHPHIHLDKPFLLNSHTDGEDIPDYSDLALEDGSFSEALSKTGTAKQRYTVADLILRGSQLIAESIQAGVTSMRAFVEVDHTTQYKCVEAGIELKQKFADRCFVQLCIFAQDPVFNAENHGAENRRYVENALEKFRGKVDVLGSTPYVEGNVEQQKKNIEWAIQTAMRNDLHLDFHLDYNLDASQEPMLWHVIQSLISKEWTKNAPGKTVVIGHCSRMTMFSNEQMEQLSSQIYAAKLPVSFVGLPTSDIFMMGRPSEGDWGGSRARGTIQVLELIRRFNLNACIGINNVGRITWITRNRNLGRHQLKPSCH